jgi:uncharacterized protein YyaL (SSP411 family)
MQLKVPPIEDINQLPPDGGEKFNRLIFEKSPYLLQHAANPVDWYPWGEEAFQQASQQDKPLFLSIGYATCHWCHVMERESFENPQAAELINKNFIPIKVDREERPDIDNIYMSVCQAVTGTGGWPLTVLLTPDKKPFFVGTYFPRESRFGRTGLMELIPKVADLWVNKRNELLDNAEKITNHLWETSQNPRGNLDPGVVQQAFDQLRSRYDPVQGGFGAAPKFPSPHNLLFLTRFWKGTGDPNALEMVEKTLQEMRLGGIYDQIGFGFHRYSTDAAWRLPHFEKMLYDQAMLTMAYMEGYLATGKTEYAQVVREVLTYVLRDMTAPEGGFYSAEDADSEGEEGLFYLWTQEEFRENLGPEAAQLFSSVFNIEEEGNFADEATNNLTGRNLLYLKAPLEEHAERVNFESDDLARLWEEVRAHLFEVREQRVHPLKDDKILTDWNGLMIAALAKAGAGLGDPSYIQAASRAADFIWDQLRDEDGKLLKRYRDGEAGLSAHLDDYAFLIWGLLELYQAGFLTSHLERALLLTKIMIEDFWDEDKGGFFFTAKGQSDLILRGKEIYDGAIPSGNSVAYQNLIRLGRMLSRPDFEEKARSIGEAFSAQINQLPRGYTQLMVGILLTESPPCEVVISGNPDSPDTREMILRLRDLYLPNKVMMLRPADPDQRLFELVPVLREQIPIEERATAYVCRNYQCNAPTTDIEELLKLVENAE